MLISNIELHCIHSQILLVINVKYRIISCILFKEHHMERYVKRKYYVFIKCTGVFNIIYQ